MYIHHLSTRFKKWSLLFILFSLFLLIGSLSTAATDSPAEDVMPIPSGTDTFNVSPAAEPVLNIDPAQANPFGFGSVANGGESISLSIAISEVSSPVDLYVGLQSDVLGPQICLFTPDNNWQPLSTTDMVPWQGSTAGGLNTLIQEDIPVSELLPGTYNFYLFMTPAGSLDTYRLWVAPLVIQFTTNLSLADWMGKIDGQVFINDIAIPGTHDSAAYQGTGGGGGWVKNQNKSLEEQMLSGIRWFDIRLRLDGSTLTAHHEAWYLQQTFNGELNTALNFLKNHPTETIIYMIKQEYSTRSDRDFSAAVYNYIQQHGLEYFQLQDRLVYARKYPRLDDVRGKIVIFRRFDTTGLGHALGYKVKWRDNTRGTNYRTDGHDYQVQDNYHRPDLDPKFGHFKHCLNEAVRCYGSSWLFLNFASYYTNGHTNYTNAERINPKVDDLVKSKKGQRGGGVTLLSYPFAKRPNLVKHIIQMNQLY